ncbi:hypothetical protein HELRODRAFT_86753, partial [Helobdella robusta]|uniref:EGF-like domain-containing protein n=1 Tax=Helobdella robusta TaxID=6412 RepID=T1G6G5_HELRO
CKSDPCKNNGSCTNTGDDYECSCQAGYIGKTCSAIDYCVSNLCKNGASCRSLSGSFECKCLRNFYGRLCEISDYCKDVKPCLNEGVCKKKGDLDFECFCRAGFSGKNCKIEEFCLSSPCKHNGTCIQRREGYKCECNVPYIGWNCEVEDVCTHSNPCKNNAKCDVGADGKYYCQCTSVYEGPNCEFNKQCMESKCENKGVCYEKEDGGYFCRCLGHYSGSNCEKLDGNADVCSSAPCLNGGTCKVKESNSSSYDCTCKSGFFGNECHEKVNIYKMIKKYVMNCLYPLDPTTTDHCSSDPCMNGGQCTLNIHSDYKCECSNAYTGVNCEFENKCADEQLCSGRGKCTYVFPASFKCHCNGGYEGDRCEGVETACSKKPCKNDGTCQVDGALYKCLCKSPFTGSHCEKKGE